MSVFSSRGKKNFAGKSTNYGAKKEGRSLSKIQDFLGKLVCEEDTADLRDALNLALLYMQHYYKTLRSRSHSNTISPSTEHRSLSGTLLFTSSCGAISPVSPACGVQNQFEWRWFNLESPRLSASLGTTEFSSLSPFLHAAKTGDFEVLKELIGKDPDIGNCVDGLGRNGVMYTVHGNTDKHTECLELILKETDCSLDHQANDDSTALHVAAHANNSSALCLLLQNKSSCNIADNEGRTALHWAAANPSVDNLRLLLQHGASIVTNDSEGLTPAMWACHFEQLQNLLLLKSALVRTDPRDDALYEETDLKGRTVVHWAVNKTGSIECLTELLTENSGLLCDREKMNILHTSAEQGVLPACQLVLDVCGSDCLSMTDNKGRTPLHLAALCGHAEIINFLLEKGANLSACDNNGLTPVDLIKRKHLYYCMMVLGLNPQYQNLNDHKDVPATSSHSSVIGETGNDRKISPYSAPPAREVCDNDILKENLKQGSQIKAEVSCISNRRKSDPDQEQPAMPTPLPRRSRNKSAPPSVSNQESGTDKTKPEKENLSKDTIIAENHKSDSSSSEGKEIHGQVRRQSLLMRQDGIQEELAPTVSGSTIMHAPDGEVLVLLGDIDDLQTNVGDLDDFDKEIECGDNQDDEDNFGYTSRQLAEGRGSASSFHSEPDHADNCSVSVELSVSSLGSDNEEIVHHDEFDGNDHPMSDYYQASEPPRIKTSTQSYGNEQPRQPMHLPSGTSQLPPHPPQGYSHPPKHPSNDPHQHGNTFPVEPSLDKDKKKKKKNKSKKKLSNSELPQPVGPLRGTVAPLEPPETIPHGSPKLGGMEMMAPRPGPWEHASLGILRRGSPESPRFGPNASYRTSEDLDVETMNLREGCTSRLDRPRTPEPPRDIANKPVYHPAHPGMGAGGDMPMAVRIQREDRETLYNPCGPLVHGQSLQRNTDMVRGSQSGKLDTRTSIASLSRSKSPQFSLHGPMPHPPQK